MKTRSTALFLCTCFLLLAGTAVAQSGRSAPLAATSVERFLQAHPEWTNAFTRDDKGAYRSTNTDALAALSSFERTPSGAFASTNAQAAADARQLATAQAPIKSDVRVVSADEALSLDTEIHELEQAMTSAHPEKLPAMQALHQELTKKRDHQRIEQ